MQEIQGQIESILSGDPCDQGYHLISALVLDNWIRKNNILFCELSVC